MNILKFLSKHCSTRFICIASWRPRRCRKFEKKISSFLAYYTPRPPMSVHKKISAQSVQPFGPAIGNIYIYIRMSRFIYIDCCVSCSLDYLSDLYLILKVAFLFHSFLVLTVRCQSNTMWFFQHIWSLSKLW